MKEKDMSIAAYAGSFDPLTKGHLNLIRRGTKLFDHLYIAVGNNPKKGYTFDHKERVNILREVIKDPKITVLPFEGLLVDFCKEQGISVILRGLRAVTDFEFEFQMGMANMNLEPEIETLFLLTDLDTLYISSSMVKEIAAGGRDVSRYVPALVADRLKAKFAGS